MALNMDERTQRSFIRFLAKEMKAYWRAAAAHHAVLHILKDMGIPNIDQLLEQVKASPELQKKFDQYWAGFDELLPLEEEAFMSNELVKLIHRWADGKLPN